MKNDWKSLQVEAKRLNIDFTKLVVASNHSGWAFEEMYQHVLREMDEALDGISQCDFQGDTQQHIHQAHACARLAALGGFRGLAQQFKEIKQCLEDSDQALVQENLMVLRQAMSQTRDLFRCVVGD